MKNAITYVMIAIAVIAMLTGCYTERKAQRQVIRAQAEHPQTVASLCGNLYPPLEFTKDSIVYRHGEPQWRYDTVEVDCDSVASAKLRSHNNGAQTGTRLIRVPCPPCPVRVDTVYRNTTTQVVNRAREKELLEANYLLPKKRVWMLLIAAAGALILIYLIIRTRKS